MSRALGVRVEQHDDGSHPGMFDLRIVYADRPAGAVEVTAAADAEMIEFWRLIDPGERWVDPALAGGWSVNAVPSARFKELRKLLPAFLSSLETAGIRDVRAGERMNPPLEQVAEALGVTTAFQSPETDYPGSIYLTPEYPPERSGGWIADTGDALAAWVGDFLGAPERDDVRRKLANSQADERHACVFLPAFGSDAPFSVTDLLMRDGAPLPLDDPTLPSEVSHVWIASSWASGQGFRWALDTGWAAFDDKPVRETE